MIPLCVSSGGGSHISSIVMASKGVAVTLTGAALGTVQ